MSTESEAITVVELRKVGFGRYTVPLKDLDVIMEEIRTYPEPGDAYKLDFYDMPRAEFEALPEWDGW